MCLTELILYSRFWARQNFPLDAGLAIVVDLGPICGMDEFPNIWSDISVRKSEPFYHITGLKIKTYLKVRKSVTYQNIKTEDWTRISHSRAQSVN